MDKFLMFVMLAFPVFVAVLSHHFVVKYSKRMSTLRKGHPDFDQLSPNSPPQVELRLCDYLASNWIKTRNTGIAAFIVVLGFFIAGMLLT